MHKVYVTQEVAGRDISAAEKYGKITVLSVPGDYNFSIDILAQTIEARLATLTRNDWLLLMGDPVLMAVTAALAYKNIQVLRLLKWDKFKADYIPITYGDN